MAKTPAAQAMAKGNKLILEGVAMLSSVYDFALMDRLRLHAPVLLPAHHLFKINRLFQAIQTDKKVDQHYGFTHLTEDCFALGAAPVCQGYVFYNDKHPTFPVEQMISDRFIQPTPQPSKTAYGI